VAQNKYVIFKNEDAKMYLNQAQKAQLLDILKTIQEARRTAGKSVNDLFFVLNMKDEFALNGLDSYISAIKADGRLEHDGLAKALKVAEDVRRTAAINIDTRLPD
jgi:hypothetical protein